jgi:cell wall-associated NlpC family hydrolase
LHFEVRLNGALLDPKSWLAGAPDIAVDAAVVFDPALASQLRGELAEAEAAQQIAQDRANEIAKELTKLRKRNNVIRRSAERAHRVVLNQIRDVYKLGVDPQWLVNIEAFDAGDWRSFADRRVVSEYTSNAKSNALDEALATLTHAKAHEDRIAALQREANDTLAAATKKMTDLQAKVGAGQLALAGTQFDGVVPPGGTPRAQAAAKFALSQVGAAYDSAGGTGPTYGCNGFVWRAWHEAGSAWPVQMANDQALNRQWVSPVAAGQEQTGDLVFWRMNNGTDEAGRIDHVGIVVNSAQGLFVHASSPRTGVEVNNYKSSSYYQDVAMFGRVVR